MKIMNFMSKKVTQMVGAVVAGTTNGIIDTVSQISKNATSSALDIRNEITKKNAENCFMKSKTAEDKLKKLKNLVDSELITQIEYDTKKARILIEL